VPLEGAGAGAAVVEGVETDGTVAVVVGAEVVVVFEVPLSFGSRSLFSCSYAAMTSCQMIAGIVPPSTGAPLYSVSMGFTESA
jgi:hypothetical protein